VRTVVDARGSLGFIEAERDIPFAIKRVYFVKGMAPNLPRGFHAHHRTRQFAICLAGSCRIVMETPKEPRADILLSAADHGVLIDPMVWHEMHDFSPDCILLVLASEPYFEADYIRSRTAWEELLRASGA
jgi:dTDP-4-dehydrorhamnose 3,5-epimerase-like enzyme